MPNWRACSSNPEQASEAEDQLQPVIEGLQVLDGQGANEFGQDGFVDGEELRHVDDGVSRQAGLRGG